MGKTVMTNINKWIWFANVLVAFSVGAASQQNFIIFLADDLGCRDLGVEGSSFYETPNIDRLAHSGMRFSQCYAASAVCSPSRASLMTGKATTRHGVTDWIGAHFGNHWVGPNAKMLPVPFSDSLSPEEVTLAEALREGGYKTFIAGKWHLGNAEKDLPERHGFDVNQGGWPIGPPKYFSPWFNPKLENRTPGENLTLRLADETIQFIEENRARPFFAYVSFHAPHGPLETTKELWAKYREKAVHHPVEKRFKIDRTLPVRQVQDNPVYAGMVETLDTAVGRVLDKLSQLGLDKNTVVIFTSDNGGASAGNPNCTSNLPFRGSKGQYWEGGLRVPFYIRVPGMTSAGSHSDIPVIHTDIYPTFLDLAGLKGRPEQHVDGISLVPALRGGHLEQRDLFWHYPHYGSQGWTPSSVIRSKDWKLIHFYESGESELYNLALDPFEKNDVSAAHPDRVAGLTRKLTSWLEETGAKFPERDLRFREAGHQDLLRMLREQRMPELELQQAEMLEPDWRPDASWWDSEPILD
jgi:arylsulfatase A-like enzyme